MNPFVARAGAESSRLLSGPRFAYYQDGLGATYQDVPPEGFTINYGDLHAQLGQAAAARDAVQAQIDAIYEAAIGAGFRVGSGKPWYVVGIPAVAGTNEQLIVLNAENEAQRSAWNAELETLWPQLPPLIEAVRAIEAQINAVTAAGPSEGGVPESGLPVGQVMSFDELEAKRIRDFVTVSPPYCIPQATWDGIAPSVQQYLSPDLVCNIPVAPLETGGFDPSSAFTPVVTATCAPGYVWDGKACVPMESPSMFPKPNGSAAPIAPSGALDVVDVTKTGTPVNVKGQPKDIDWNTALVVPTPDATIDEGEIPAPMTAGIGGGMLGMLALGGLALAVLAAPKRKR